jgi:hypothetical protein
VGNTATICQDIELQEGSNFFGVAFIFVNGAFTVSDKWRSHGFHQPKSENVGWLTLVSTYAGFYYILL